MNKTYAGIGSRKITGSTSLIFMKFACCMAFAGYKLNSGAADGSDTSFERGAQIAYDEMARQSNAMIPFGYKKVHSVYLGWKGFNHRKLGAESGYIFDIPPKAETITAGFHPGWNDLKPAVRKLMSRNACQILGHNLDEPAKFVMCYTPDGAYTADMTSGKTGGTGQAIRIADHYGVPVYNLTDKNHAVKIDDWINTYSEKIIARYGVDPRILVEDYMLNLKGVKKARIGDLVSAAVAGDVDVIVHGCNCQITMGSGIAKRIAGEFPEAVLADQKTRKGDRKKLGTYSSAKVVRDGREIVIINAYTQFDYGRENKLYADYEAIRKVFAKIKTDFGSKRIGVPKIGAGLANGCWATISNAISGEMEGSDLTLFTIDESHEKKPEPRTPPEASQFSMDL